MQKNINLASSLCSCTSLPHELPKDSLVRVRVRVRVTHPARLHPGDAVLLEELEERNRLFVARGPMETRVGMRRTIPCVSVPQRSSNRNTEGEGGTTEKGEAADT